MKVEEWFRDLERKRCLYLSLVLLTMILVGCVSRQSIQIPFSAPLPHPQLAKTQSISPKGKRGNNQFWL